MNPTEPWTVGPESGPRVLMLHGLTGGPSELWPLACGLSAVGFRCELPWWPGHGTTPEELAVTPSERLVEEARALGRRDWDAVLGLSMGALLGVVAASQSSRPVPLVLLAPAWRMAGSAKLFDKLKAWPFPGRLLIGKGTDWGEGDVAADGVAGRAALAAPRREGVRYEAVPLAWARRLDEIRHAAHAAAARVNGPVHVLHGLADDTADPRAASEVAAWFPDAKVEWIGGASHQLAAGPCRGLVADRVARILADLSASKSA